MEQKVLETRKFHTRFDLSDSTLLRWEHDYTLDAKTLRTSWNVKELLGYTEADFNKSAELFTSYIHKDDIEPLRRELQDALKSQCSSFSHSPYRFTKKDGSEKWIRHNTLVVRDKEKVVTYYVSYLSIIDMG